ncbi:SRPBCC family protein [Streptomyces sp. NPDC050315]|uniref:type II toxin-antitoxin system RatA family toxin n=1 Tax=Streptomyces sp. NPDC050315 TaxID=3155039 RepID=UPI003437C9B9
MPHVTVHAIARGLEPADAYNRITDLGRYPELADVVRELNVRTLPDGSVISEWAVSFRGGLMRWQERDTFSPEQLTFTFEQTEGDFESYEGSWRCAPSDDGTLIVFSATFDLGIPTLAEIIDPVAESTLRTNVTSILTGLVDVEVLDDCPAAARG